MVVEDIRQPFRFADALFFFVSVRQSGEVQCTVSSGRSPSAV